MADREPATDPGSHHLVCRGTAAEFLDAEDRLIALACEYGDGAYLRTATDDLGDRAPDTRRILAERLEYVGESVDVDPGERPTWRADLPADREPLLSALSVPESDRAAHSRLGEARWRLWDVHTVLVVRDGEWVYRSIPHERQLRVRADLAPEVPERAGETLAGLPCVLVPDDPVATWDGAPSREQNDGPARKPGGQLTHERVAVDGTGWPLSDLRRVVVDRRRRELALDWVDPDERRGRPGGRLLGTIARGVGWVLDREEPPSRVRLENPEAFEAVVAALEDVRETVGWEFEVHHSRPGGDG